MQMTGARQFRNKAARYLSGDEPVLITKHGKIAGLYLPLENPTVIPDDLRKELAAVLGKHLNELLERHSISESEILEDFGEYRRNRR